MYFESNIDNDEYIMINIHELLPLAEMIQQNYNDSIEISKEVYNIFNQLHKEVLVNNFGHISHIAIRKDSLLGQFLIKNTDFNKIYNKDLIVSYEKVCNAYLVATYENNCKMANKISIFLKGQIEGTKQELINKENQNSEEVVNYILKNDNFKLYIEKMNGEYKPKEYIVYENEIFSKKILSKEKQKIKKKA